MREMWDPDKKLILEGSGVEEGMCPPSRQVGLPRYKKERPSGFITGNI